MDDEQRSFIRIFRAFLDEVVNAQPAAEDLTPLGEIVAQHMGADVAALPIVTEELPAHRLVDADLALGDLAAVSPSARLIGISHGQMRWHEGLSAFLVHSAVPFREGPVDYESIPSGPTTSRRVVSLGLHLLAFHGVPVTVLQRAARPEAGRQWASIEVLCADPDAADRFIVEFRAAMLRLSVLRGQVLSLTPSEFGQGSGGAVFLARPAVTADDVVLGEGVLESVTRHVVGIGQHRDRLTGAGQHLKRGVLLYGPPGTGKTLTVRHLLARTTGTTAILLTGPSIAYITEAAEIARAMQPSLVVLEDVDLVAGDRMIYHGPQPLLFAVLDALDGLDGDADVTFVLTTNRVELLERALADRPGRIDLAVEIGLPDRSARRRLFALYARDLPFSPKVVENAADRADGVTGSFAKELVRRAVLTAAEHDREVDDGDLEHALDELLSARQALTRSLLGAGGRSSEEQVADEPPAGAGHWYATGGGSTPAMSSSLFFDYDSERPAQPDTPAE